MTTQLIYCADGNKRFADIAIRYGLKYGAQLPNTIHHAPHFTDQNWRNPDRTAYMAAIQEHRPALATVLDYERADQFGEVMAWAEEAAQHVGTVIIIPKVIGDVDRIPESINGKPVRLGYSVPTKFAGTSVPVWEFRRRPVHLLGGSPHEQHRLAGMMNVASADGNYIQKMAVEYNQFFSAGKVKGRNGHYPRLDTFYGKVEEDAPYMAFELSCMNIQALWAGCRATVRLARDNDLTRVKQIANQYKQELGFVTLPSLQTNLHRRSLLVAEYNGFIVGFVNYRACLPTKKDVRSWSTVYEIAVDKARRGEHIGAGLLAAVPGPVRLKCVVDNPANAFYERMGFTCTGTEQGRVQRLNKWVKA